MNSAHRLIKWSVMAILFGFVSFALDAQEQLQSQPSKPNTVNQENTPDQDYFTNTVLVNQYGEMLMFYDDLLKDKTVIINSFYTRCKEVCPIMNDHLKAIKTHFDQQTDSTVYILSITIDPNRDKPSVLNEYAKPYEPDSTWLFLSGNPSNVNKVLFKMGLSVEKKKDCKTLFLVGNNKTKHWKKLGGLAPVEDLIEAITSVVNSEN